MEDEEVICLSSDDEDSPPITSPKTPKKLRLEVELPFAGNKTGKRKVQIGFSNETDCDTPKKLRLIADESIDEISIVLPDNSSNTKSKSDSKPATSLKNNAKSFEKFDFSKIRNELHKDSKFTRTIKVVGKPENVSETRNQKLLDQEDQEEIEKLKKSKDTESIALKTISQGAKVIPDSPKSQKDSVQERNSEQKNGGSAKESSLEKNVESSNNVDSTVNSNIASNSQTIKRIKTTHTPFVQESCDRNTNKRSSSPEIEIVETIAKVSKPVDQISSSTDQICQENRNNQVSSTSNRRSSQSSDSEISCSSESSKNMSKSNSKRKTLGCSRSSVITEKKSMKNLPTITNDVIIRESPKKISLALKSNSAKKVDGDEPKLSSEPREESGSSKSSTESPKKPQLVIKSIKPVESDSQSTFAMFLSLCLQTKRTEDMKTIVAKLKRNYDQLDPKYAKSKEFNDLLNKIREKIMAKSNAVYHYISQVNDEMKPRRLKAKSSKTKNIEEKSKEGKAEEAVGGDDADKNEESANEEVEDNSPEAQRLRKKIKMINHTMKRCAKRIEQLEVAEVEFNDDNDSAYIKLSRYKEKMIELYRKLCEYTNEHADAGRAYLRPKHLRVTQIPSIDQAINSFINSKLSCNKTKGSKRKSFVDNLIFPDYIDILKCVAKVNDDQDLGLTKRKQQKLAQDAFSQLGKHLQKARQTDYWDTFSFNLEDGKDPAVANPTLAQKLQENQEIAEKNTNAIFNEYVKKQEEQGLKGSESNGTEDDSNNEEDNDEEDDDEEDDDDDDDEDEENDSTSMSTDQPNECKSPKKLNKSKNVPSSSEKNSEGRTTESSSNSSQKNSNDRITNTEDNDLTSRIDDTTEINKKIIENVTADKTIKEKESTPSDSTNITNETDSNNKEKELCAEKEIVHIEDSRESTEITDEKNSNNEEESCVEKEIVQIEDSRESTEITNKKDSDNKDKKSCAEKEIVQIEDFSESTKITNENGENIKEKESPAEKEVVEVQDISESTKITNDNDANSKEKESPAETKVVEIQDFSESTKITNENGANIKEKESPAEKKVVEVQDVSESTKITNDNDANSKEKESPAEKKIMETQDSSESPKVTDENDSVHEDNQTCAEETTVEVKEKDSEVLSFPKITLRQLINEELLQITSDSMEKSNSNNSKLKKKSKKTNETSEENSAKVEHDITEEEFVDESARNESKEIGDTKDAEADTKDASEAEIVPPRPLRIRSFAKPPSFWSNSQDSNVDMCEVTENPVVDSSEISEGKSGERSIKNAKILVGSKFRDSSNFSQKKDTVNSPEKLSNFVTRISMQRNAGKCQKSIPSHTSETNRSKQTTIPLMFRSNSSGTGSAQTSSSQNKTIVSVKPRENIPEMLPQVRENAQSGLQRNAHVVKVTPSVVVPKNVQALSQRKIIENELPSRKYQIKVVVNKSKSKESSSSSSVSTIVGSNNSAASMTVTPLVTNPVRAQIVSKSVNSQVIRLKDGRYVKGMVIHRVGPSSQNQAVTLKNPRFVKTIDSGKPTHRMIGAEKVSVVTRVNNPSSQHEPDTTYKNE